MTPTDNDIIASQPDIPDLDLGGLYEEDPRDWPVADLYAAAGLEAAGAFPSAYAVAAMPAVLNQLSPVYHPWCVAEAGSAMKNHQDRLDQGKFFDFDEGRFFAEIGGTDQGAYIGTALARLKGYGYPVVSAGQASLHKIAAYYAVPLTVEDLKAAILAFGPLWCIGSWFHSYNRPGSSGILPAPDYRVSGHSTVLYGWDDAKGMRFRNSFGPNWGASGDFYAPFSKLFKSQGGYLGAAYKTVDAIEYPEKVMACGAKVRPDAHFGTSLGTIAIGARIRVSGSVAGSTWSKTSACNPTVPNSGSKWYRVPVINGRAVSALFPGHSVVYIYAGAVKGG